jgi:hypothetical protein
LKEKGFGGIYGVGKAAEHKPALVVLSHTPESATRCPFYQSPFWAEKFLEVFLSQFVD